MWGVSSLWLDPWAGFVAHRVPCRAMGNVRKMPTSFAWSVGLPTFIRARRFMRAGGFARSPARSRRSAGSSPIEKRVAAQFGMGATDPAGANVQHLARVCTSARWQRSRAFSSNVSRIYCRIYSSPPVRKDRSGWLARGSPRRPDDSDIEHLAPTSVDLLLSRCGS